MNTWEEHRDYQNLSSVLTDIKLIANFVNESMKIGDIVTRVYEIDLALGGQCVRLLYLQF